MFGKILVLSFALAALSCAGQKETAPAPSVPAAEPPSTVAAVEVAAPEMWAQARTKEQKIAFMKVKVMPALAPVFQQADATKYADFSCATCHGPEYKETKSFLENLELKGGQLTAFAEEPEVAKFMAERVTPAMAQVLGQSAYNPENHTGFGCGGCHAISMN